MTHRSRRTQFTMLAMFLIAILIARNASAQALPAGQCIAFEDLPLHAEYHVGDTITTGLFELKLRPFIDEDGNTVTEGFVRVENGGQAGGSGKELLVNNINVSLVISPTEPLDGLRLRFGEFGGNLNIHINGNFRNFANFMDIFGNTVAGVDISGTGGNGQDRGTLTLDGPLTTFAVGGQELFLDDLCPVRQPPEPGPDLGDAPDSSNHVGIANTAYPAIGVNGNFPTVWDSTPSGPKHLNQSMEGWLGDRISREQEADMGPDQDPANNILDGGADNANNDRGDDGWLNPGVAFVDCQPTTVRVRISKSATAALQAMYLNVWFDGNRDGDWADMGQCQASPDGPVARSFEWIVQDFVVNMAAIPAGGFVDIPVNTRLVMNTTSGEPHWLRFTLSDRPTPKPANPAPADGRGPQHPNAFEYGETEDYPQRPRDAGQPGVLVIDKGVITDDDIMHPGDIVTYTIRLEHQGGTVAARSELIDQLPELVRLAGPVQVREETPSVTPLQVRSSPTAIGWRGELSPDAKLNLTFPVRVLRCFGDQTRTVKNVVSARQTDGTRIEADASFTVQCLPISLDEIAVVQTLVIDDQAADATAQPAAAAMDDPVDWIAGTPARIRVAVTNNGPQPAALSLNYTKITYADLSSSAMSADDQTARTLAITLAPGETQTFYRELNAPPLDDDPISDDEPVLVSNIRYCLQQGDHPGCPNPDANPDAPVGHAPPLHIRIIRRDLGDAPDSSNHFVQPMSAYPGVPANFPTVFDPAAGLPQGPSHLRPRPFHLGEQVSSELEADSGPDQEFVNNINPPADAADRDRYDDGARPPLWTLDHCRVTKVPVRVAISPQAVAYFSQQDEPGYLNIWLDANRDGDWADATDCPAVDNLPPAALEHVVIDYPVDVVTLGAGLHTLDVPTGRVPWPAELAERPAWVRVTLSERPSNKTLTFAGIDYGDGRGYDRPFRLGESEDYLWRPANNPGGVDMVIRKQGRVRQDFDLASSEAQSTIAWTIEYYNRGDRAANNVVIRDHLEDGQNIIAILIGLLADPEVPHRTDGSDLVFDVGTVEAGEGGRIVIITELTQPMLALTSVRNVAEVSATDDVDASNNRAEAAVAVGVRPPRIVTPIDGTTCQNEVQVAGRAEANAQVDLYIDNTLAATITANENGRWQTTVSLADGPHTLVAIAKVGPVTSPRSQPVTVIVDSTLLWNPISLKFIDPRGHVHQPHDADGRLDADGWGLRLRPRTTYTASVAICCADGENAVVTLNVDGIGEVALHDDDGDGVYTGSFTSGERNPDPVVMTLTVACGDSEASSSGQVVLIDPDGVVYDATTGQLLAEATVACLVGVSDGASNTLFSLWNAADFGQVNPQTTAADGYFSFETPAGLYRLDAGRDGYQPYHSRDIIVQNAAVRYDIPLSPIVAADADYVIQVSEDGFSPALLTVAPGAVIEWVNVGVDEHSTTSTSPVVIAPAAASGWDSGLITAGASYKLQLDGEGMYTYQDAQNPFSTATIIVQEPEFTAQNGVIFLPLVRGGE